MSMAFRRLMALSSVIAWVGGTNFASAQTFGASDYYSQGVHAYFAGRSSLAEGLLSTAISLEPTDPRAHYFRALALLRQGRRAEAQMDMQVGASIETQQPGRFAVGTALERVQGPDRLLLEQYRAGARSARAALSAETNRRRYQQISQSEPEVLHRKGTIPLEQIASSNGSRPPVVFEKLGRPQPATLLAPPRPLTSALGAGDSDDPFPDDPQPVTGAAPAGPVAGPTPSAAPATATPSPAAFDDDPFGAATTPAAPATPRPMNAVPPVEDDLFRTP